ncbi:DoxX family protein [Pseudarthrobacter sp. CC12]|uniref:DoxX family protein n=1 Tax=Pseudarthrobacter sp. CC12 TaxID=3029193 RepID=UPI003266B1C1
MNKSALTTTALAALRIILGFLFAAHGWQKFNEWTIAGTKASFAKMGVPAADVMAPAIAVLELAGGIALILGILTRVVAALLVVDMLGALFLVHAPAGIFAANGGYELVLLLAAASFALALTGAGRLSVDRALFGRRPESRLAVLA